MSSRGLNLTATLSFRLTIWYAAVFAFSTILAFLLLYLSISSGIERRSDHALLAELKEISSLMSLKGLDSVKTQINVDAEAKGVTQVFFRLMDPQGNLIASSNLSPWQGVGIGRTALKRLAGGTDRFIETVSLPHEDHKAKIIYGKLDPDHVLQIGQSLEDDEAFVRMLRDVFGATMVVLVPFGGLAGWLIAKRALRGIEEVTRTATSISKGALDRRVRVQPGGAEVDNLATAFNSMLDRIHGLITEMRQMTDNIAHDLKTPLARVRGIAEMALNAETSPDDDRAMAFRTIEECDRLLGIINTMLDISEAEAGITAVNKREVDLIALLEDACDLFRPLAEEKDIQLLALPSSRPVQVLGDIRSLQRMLSNLIDNALKYTPSHGLITLSVDQGPEGVAISVSDTGIGISHEDLPRIFDRFFRCDASRSLPGSGLGLTLARAIARTHGGDVTVASDPGRGSVFTVTLPMNVVFHPDFTSCPPNLTK